MLDMESFEATVRANAFANYNGITVRQLELGKAEAQLTVGANNYNPHGKLHGGAYYTSVRQKICNAGWHDPLYPRC